MHEKSAIDDEWLIPQETITVEGIEYTIERNLSRGGMGYVCEATDPNGKRVAIKRVHDFKDPHQKRMLEVEIQVLQRLKKFPFVQQFVAADQAQAILVTELVDRARFRSLFELCLNGELDKDSRIALFQDLATAFDQLATDGYFNTDESLRDIFIAKDGYRQGKDISHRLRLLDLAGNLGAHEHFFTAEPRMMAPEVLLMDQTSKVIDKARASVFKLGIIVCTLLSPYPEFLDKVSVFKIETQNPAVSASMFQFAQRIKAAMDKNNDDEVEAIQHEVVAFTQRFGDSNRYIDDLALRLFPNDMVSYKRFFMVMDKALSKDQNKRYSTCAAFMKELIPLLHIAEITMVQSVKRDPMRPTRRM